MIPVAAYVKKVPAQPHEVPPSKKARTSEVCLGMSRAHRRPHCMQSQIISPRTKGSPECTIAQAYDG